MNNKINNWYSGWALISIILFILVGFIAFSTSLAFAGTMNYPFNLELSFNSLLGFFLILSIYSGIKGIRKAKDLNGKGKVLSIICLILGIIFFSLFLFHYLLMLIFFLIIKFK